MVSVRVGYSSRTNVPTSSRLRCAEDVGRRYGTISMRHLDEGTVTLRYLKGDLDVDIYDMGRRCTARAQPNALQ